MCIWDNVTFLYIISQLFKMLQKVWNSLNKNKQHSDFIYGNPLHHFHYNSSDCFFVTSFWQISASPRQLHIKLQATLAEAHEHRLVLQWLDVLQPHFTIFRTSSGAAAMVSCKPMGTSTLFSSSFLQPYRVGSTAGGSAYIVAYYTMACKSLLLYYP